MALFLRPLQGPLTGPAPIGGQGLLKGGGACASEALAQAAATSLGLEIAAPRWLGLAWLALWLGFDWLLLGFRLDFGLTSVGFRFCFSFTRISA